MSTRRAKQLIYGVLYFLILAGIFSGIYYLFFRPAITPATVVQCTGICPPSGTDSITTSSVATFVTSPGHYTFLAQVVNHNGDFAAQNFNYSIDLYDAAGVLIGSIPGSSFIYSSQSKYLVVPNQGIASSVAYAGITLKDVNWVPGSSLGIVPQFTLQNTQVSMTTTTISVGGQITNTDISSFNKVFVVVIFKGSDGTPVGASQTEVDNVNPNQSISYSVIYPAAQNIDASNNQIFVYALRP